MLFRFNINLTEDDYLAFSKFNSFESTHGKKQLNKSRILLIALMIFMIAIVLLLGGFTPVTSGYAILVTILTVLYLLLLKKILNYYIKAQIKRMKKIGKLPFDPVSTVEFDEDKLTEATAASRTEQSYSALEKICVIKDRYILLYNSSISAYILPIQQIKAQSDTDEFLRFISSKCKTVEYY
ncbi:MAG: YcxB family protein [Clostridia bacterium]|nr:YcxB family protein [Clostridia bacterium]